MIHVDDLPFKNAGGATYVGVDPESCFDQALAMLDYDDFRRQQAAGVVRRSAARRRRVAVHRADRVGRRDADRYRSGAREDHAQRSRHGGARHRRPRPEHRDDDGADRRRRAGRRLRRRHGDRRRHRHLADRRRHRRQPLGRHRRCRGASVREPGARQDRRDRGPHARSRAQRPRDRSRVASRFAARRRVACRSPRSRSWPT